GHAGLVIVEGCRGIGGVVEVGEECLTVYMVEGRLSFPDTVQKLPPPLPHRPPYNMADPRSEPGTSLRNGWAIAVSANRRGSVSSNMPRLARARSTLYKASGSTLRAAASS